jgi:NAD(P)-dependent dehydrogenase (short-subunit alcohol dehydrogenase family)
MSLSNSVILITGAGPGMGRAVALEAAKAGGDVVLVARTRQTLEQTAELVAKEGRRALCLPADVTDAAAMQEVIDKTLQQFGRIDVLVHSILPPHLFKRVLALEEADLQEWKRSVEISTYGALLVSRAVAHPMVKAGKGSIVFVTATSAFQGYPAVSAHAVGKAGIHSLAQCLASELGPLGVRVNSVAVGVIDGETAHSFPTDLAPEIHADIQRAIDASDGALRRNVTEREVAEAVLFFASDASSGTCGQILAVDGGRFFH